jgi:hypothetical protein
MGGEKRRVRGGTGDGDNGWSLVVGDEDEKDG